MKKLSVFIALALLAIAGTGYAVTCAYDNVPAATLLVPYWKVSRNGSTGGNIPGGGIDTLVAVTNVSATGIILHAMIFNKYSRPVLDWNIPMTGYDVCFFSLRDVLNGDLNNNKNVQNDNFLKLLPTDPNYGIDPCGVNQRQLASAAAAYPPSTIGWGLGFGQTLFLRFPHPNFTDARLSIGYYSTPAFSGSFRTRVWDALDESGDVTSFTNPFRPNIIDVDPNCGTGRDGVYSGDFSGYMLLDVNNFCSRYFADQMPYYINDAIATAGWAQWGYSPNTIMGDVFYLDSNATAGAITGDPMVALEFDTRLEGVRDTLPPGNGNAAQKTFYARYWDSVLTPDLIPGAGLQLPYAFIGDGREPLGNRYGFRYYNGVPDGAQTWAQIYRGDIYRQIYYTSGQPDVTGYTYNLCDWWFFCADPNTPVFPYCQGSGLFDSTHQLVVRTFDNDENTFVSSGGPSGGAGGTASLYVFLESQRYSLLNNTDINPSNFTGGWIDVTFPGINFVGYGPGFFNNTWVGVQHTAPGALLSVGHSATLINNQFLCQPYTGRLSIYNNAGIAIPGNIW